MDPAPVLPPVERERPIIVTSRSRAPYAAAVVAHALDADAVRLGSAGAKAMSVVNGETDIYVHDGGMYQWDSAAPAAVALAAGLHVSRIDGIADRLQRPRSVAPRLHRVPPGVGQARAVRPLGRLRAIVTLPCCR